jgi:hypothetical protein
MFSLGFYLNVSEGGGLKAAFDNLAPPESIHVTAQDWTKLIGRTRGSFSTAKLSPKFEKEC